MNNNSASSTTGQAFAGFADFVDSDGSLTTDGNSASALNGAVAEAGSNDTLDSGNLVIDNNVAKANGANAAAYAASYGNGGSDNTAIATTDGTGSATAVAGGNS